MALRAYRHILRATRIAFKGDQRLLPSARAQARSSFAENRSLLPSSQEAIDQIAHAEEVAKILRQNVVQGQQVESEQKADKYRLRIHEEIERGDNETIKMASKSINSLGGECCGGQ
ncbi:Mitochondrial zinc maintenance protein 1, mitochondrial [Varicellaria rhodocarpa]|nr:Mitochondrial zinc maintenance protein 1, mitochondrial [Varicellaria rhodocarpa]